MVYKSKKVLFICKGNWFRSQMAAAIYNKMTNSNSADSAGTYVGSPEEPEGQILSNLFPTPDFFELMENNGMDVRNNKTKKLLPEMLEKYNTVISMAEEPFIPNFLKENKKVIWWNVENPNFVDKNKAEEIYNIINKLVIELIEKNK